MSLADHTHKEYRLDKVPNFSLILNTNWLGKKEQNNWTSCSFLWSCLLPDCKSYRSNFQIQLWNFSVP